MFEQELQQLTAGLTELATELGPLARGETGPLWLALDQGGHASRALVFDSRGRLVAQAFATIGTQQHGTNRVEHDAQEIVRSLRTVIDDISHALGRDVDLVQAAGLATQRSSIVCWDARTAQPLSPVLSWQDRRNAALVDQLQEHRADIQAHTGLVLSPHYGASKLRWCLDNLPEVQHAHQQGHLHCGPLASYLLHALLEEHPHVIDPANASRTQLWSPATGDWSDPLLEWFGVPREVLPRCVPTHHGYGSLMIGERRIPLRICTGDQAAVPFAQGEPAPRAVYVNLGTGAFALAPGKADVADAAPLLRSVLRSDAQHITYALEGTVNGAGAALDWWSQRSALDVQRSLAGLQRATIQSLNPPLFLNGVGGLASPFWQADAPVKFVEDSPASELEQLVSVVESIAFLLHANLHCMRERLPELEVIHVGGGLSRCDYLCEALSDLTGLPVIRLGERELTGRGLAWLIAQVNEPPLHWAAVTQQTFVAQPNPVLLQRYQRWLELIRPLAALK